MIHIVRGQLLQIFVEILKKSASSLVDTVVVYYLEPATFGRQLKSSLFRGESKVNQGGGLGLLQGGQGLLSGCEHGGVSGHPSKAIHDARQYGGRFKIQSKWFRIDNYVGRFWRAGRFEKHEGGAGLGGRLHGRPPPHRPRRHRHRHHYHPPGGLVQAEEADEVEHRFLEKR